MKKGPQFLSKKTLLILLVSAMMASGIFLAPLHAQSPDRPFPNLSQHRFPRDSSEQRVYDQIQEGYDQPASLAEDIEDSRRFRQSVIAAMKEKFSPEMQERLRFLLQPDPRRSPEHQPMRAFRWWLQSKRPFIPVFIILMFSSLLVCSFFPTQVATAQEACRRQFWRSIGKGALVTILIALAARILVAISFTHLALVGIAFVQLITLTGLCVSISLIGNRILDKCGLSKKSWMLAHPRWATFFALFIGCLIVALITQIPGFGRFPKLGMRIVMLIAILGAGGLLKTRFGAKSISSEES